MINWRSVPFLRILFFFTIGICFALLTENRVSLPVIIIPLLSILLIIFAFQRISHNNRWIFGMFLHICMVLLGFQLTQKHNELNKTDHLNRYSGKVFFSGKVNKLKTGEKYLRLYLTIHSAGETEESFSRCSGNLLAYIPLDAKSRTLQTGDEIIMNAYPMEVNPRTNPHAFDYQRYLHFKNIHFQAFPKEDEWELIGKSSAFSPLFIAQHWRSTFLKILKEYLPGRNEFAVGSALILGYKDEMTPEIRNAYASTGAMHVLAVSGLHVGLIYLGISFLLSKIPFKHPIWKFTKTLLEIGTVFGFALLAGASPSAIRAACMFTFVIIGKSLLRSTNIYNTLAASAFVMLFINPYLLMDVGFQLSYLAVIGIVYFQPKIYGLWYIENKIGDYIWKLASVSFAAQITTFPLSLFYFHQFPFYFWLSGLIVVPFATLILMSGLMLILTHSIPGIGFLFGKLLFYAIWLMDALIFGIQQLPAGLLMGIWIGTGTLFLLYFMVSCGILSIETRKYKWVLAGLTCLMIVFGLRYYSSLQQSKQKQLVIYDVSGHTMIDFMEGKQMNTLQDEELEGSKRNFAAQNHRWASGIRTANTYYLNDSITLNNNWYASNGFIQFFDKKIGIVQGPIHPSNQQKPALDYLLIRGNPNLKINALTEAFDFQKLIFDHSNSRWNIKNWQQACEKLEISTHDIQEDGAFVIDMN